MGTIKGRKYVHSAIDEAVHDRMYEYLKRRGGGKVRAGAVGQLLEKAVERFLDGEELEALHHSVYGKVA